MLSPKSESIATRNPPLRVLAHDWHPRSTNLTALTDRHTPEPIHGYNSRIKALKMVNLEQVLL